MVYPDASFRDNGLFSSTIPLKYHIHYGPQAKLRKGYVFTPVCHSVHWVGGVCPSACWDTHTPGRHPLLWADTPAPPPSADGYCCGRYASYWNAFWF